MISSLSLTDVWSRLTLPDHSSWLAIVAGLLGLAMAVAVLARLRWIQSRPIATCVVLSIFAHVLLIAVAYTMRLFDSSSRPLGAQTVSVTLLDDTSVASPTRSIPLPWEEPRETNSLPSNLLPMDAIPEQLLLDSEPVPLTGLEDEKLELDLPWLDDAVSFNVQPLGALAIPALSGTESEVVEAAENPTQADDSSSGTTSGESEEAAALTETPTLSEPANSDEPRETIFAQQDSLPSIPDELPRTTANSVSHRPTDDRIAALGAAKFTEASSHNSQVPRTQTLLNGRPLPPRFQLRSSPDRLQRSKQRGATDESERSVVAALAFLAGTQGANGRWDASDTGAGRGSTTSLHHRGNAGARADTGITGLAVLAFLGAGHTHLEGQHRAVVQRGLEFLLAEQGTDGNMAGQATHFARMYCHGMATLAICEAYAMTGDERLRPYVERAVSYSLWSQDLRSGSWRYGPHESGDMSQFGWQVMALVSASEAGLVIPAANRIAMSRFISSVSSGRHGGLAAYRPSERHRPSASMTAEALVCRLFLQAKDEPKTVAEAENYVQRNPPNTRNIDFYYWYYASIALAQLGDSSESSAWTVTLREWLVMHQRTAGSLAGSWDPIGRWGGYGGRVYSTALGALCLESYYRYFPLHQRTTNRMGNNN